MYRIEKYISALAYWTTLICCWHVLISYPYFPGKWQWFGWHDQTRLPSSSQKKTQHGVIQVSPELQTSPFKVKVTLQGTKTWVFSNGQIHCWSSRKNDGHGMSFVLSGYTHEIHQFVERKKPLTHLATYINSSLYICDVTEVYLPRCSYMSLCLYDNI